MGRGVRAGLWDMGMRLENATAVAILIPPKLSAGVRGAGRASTLGKSGQSAPAGSFSLLLCFRALFAVTSAVNANSRP
jgi:hypothetical protein